MRNWVPQIVSAIRDAWETTVAYTGSILLYKLLCRRFLDDELTENRFQRLSYPGDDRFLLVL